MQKLKLQLPVTRAGEAVSQVLESFGAACNRDLLPRIQPAPSLTEDGTGADSIGFVMPGLSEAEPERKFTQCEGDLLVAGLNR